jgi:hypothetical protein
MSFFTREDVPTSHAASQPVALRTSSLGPAAAAVTYGSLEVPTERQSASLVHSSAVSAAPRIRQRVKRRIALSDEHKVRICQIACDHPGRTHAEIAKLFFDETGLKIERSTISRVVCRSSFWLQCQPRNPASKRHGRSRFPVVENAVFELIRATGARPSSRATLTDERICEFAKRAADHAGLSDFKASPSWLNAFKNRWRLNRANSDTTPYVAYDIWQHASLESQADVLSNCDRLEDIYNLHATGLFYDAGPEDVNWLEDFGGNVEPPSDAGAPSAGLARTLQDLINSDEEAGVPSVMELVEDFGVDSSQLAAPFAGRCRCAGWELRKKRKTAGRRTFWLSFVEFTRCTNHHSRTRNTQR